MQREGQKLADKVREAKKGDDLHIFLTEVELLLKNQPDKPALLHIRAEINIKLQKYGPAINDYHKLLKIDPDDRTAAFQVGQLKTILKFNNTDIYAHPNTNLDPWMD